MEHIADGECFAVLRNVAPKPVRHEAWVNLYADGFSGLGHKSKDDADTHENPFKSRVECRHIVWHNDGSPVEDAEHEATRKALEWVQKVEAERDALKVECERLRNIETERDDLHTNSVKNIMLLRRANDRADAAENERDQWKEKAEDASRLLTDANTRREQDIALIERLEADIAQSTPLSAKSPGSAMPTRNRSSG